MVPTNLITNLTYVEDFVRVLQATKMDSCLQCLVGTVNTQASPCTILHLQHAKQYKCSHESAWDISLAITLPSSGKWNRVHGLHGSPPWNWVQQVWPEPGGNLQASWAQLLWCLVRICTWHHGGNQRIVEWVNLQSDDLPWSSTTTCGHGFSQTFFMSTLFVSLWDLQSKRYVQLLLSRGPPIPST